MKKQSIVCLIILCSFLFEVSCDTNYDTLKVVYCKPGGNETGITAESRVEIGFSDPVKRSDIEDSFTLKNSEGSVNGTFSWTGGDRFIFTPDTPMSKNGRYVIILPRNIRDKEGNTMDSDFISEFYFGNDFVPPVISSSVPAVSSGALSNIPVTQNIIINFTKSMNRESVEKNFSITPDAGGYFSWSEGIPGVPFSRLEYVLLRNLEYGRLYTFTVSSSSEDISGNSTGSDYRVNFITGDDFTPPGVESIYDSSDPGTAWNPGVLNSGVSKHVSIGVNFSEAMDRQSVERAFSITPQVQGSFDWVSDRSVRFRPSTDLIPETRYQVRVETAAKNINGLKLLSEYAVEILTDNMDSLLIKPGSIMGSNHDGDFSPLADSWPRLIDMGNGTPANKSYYLVIEFMSDIAGNLPADMNRYTIYDNLLVTTYKSTSGTGELPDQARIGDVVWVSASTVKIRIDGMTNKSSGQVPALYRITVAGGENGITDRGGNFMKEDLVIELREAIP